MPVQIFFFRVVGLYCVQKPGSGELTEEQRYRDNGVGIL